MGRKKKGVVKRAIVTPDKHFPLADLSYKLRKKNN